MTSCVISRREPNGLLAFTFWFRGTGRRPSRAAVPAQRKHAAAPVSRSAVTEDWLIMTAAMGRRSADQAVSNGRRPCESAVPGSEGAWGSWAASGAGSRAPKAKAVGSTLAGVATAALCGGFAPETSDGATAEPPVTGRRTWEAPEAPGSGPSRVTGPSGRTPSRSRRAGVVSSGLVAGDIGAGYVERRTEGTAGTGIVTRGAATGRAAAEEFRGGGRTWEAPEAPGSGLSRVTGPSGRTPSRSRRTGVVSAALVQITPGTQVEFRAKTRP